MEVLSVNGKPISVDGKMITVVDAEAPDYEGIEADMAEINSRIEEVTSKAAGKADRKDLDILNEKLQILWEIIAEDIE